MNPILQIRYRPREQVPEALSATGFEIERTLSDHFAGTGSSYHLMWKV